MLHYQELLAAWQNSPHQHKWSGQSSSPQIRRIILSGWLQWWSVIGRNRWKWENGNTGSQISNTLAAAVGRQEASVDVEVEGPTVPGMCKTHCICSCRGRGPCKACETNYFQLWSDYFYFLIWNTKMPVYIPYPRAYTCRAFPARLRWKRGMRAIAIHVLHWVTTDMKMTFYQNRGMRAVQNWAYMRKDTVYDLNNSVPYFTNYLMKSKWVCCRAQTILTTVDHELSCLTMNYHGWPGLRLGGLLSII